MVHFSVLLTIVCFKLSTSNLLPHEVIENGESSQNSHDFNHQQELMLLQDILRYSQPQNSLESCTSTASSYSSLADFISQNADAINNAVIQNEQLCQSLQLNSRQCYEDCIYYASPLTLLQNNSTDGELAKILGWYQMGGGPFGWYDTGNPDMCKYVDGTYCWTPIQMNNGLANINIQEHGCCVPGSCVGEDAEKVLLQNQYCYQGYNLTYNMMMFGNPGIINICKPLDRDFFSVGFAMVVMLFLFFVIAIIVASITTQYRDEIQQINTKLSSIDEEKESGGSKVLNVYDHHWFLYCFSIQNLWKQFTRRRSKDKSQFNFLDGIRVGSMSWVIWGHIYIFYALSSPSNQATLMPFGADAKSYPYVFTKLYMMLAEYGFFSVDSFFYLSGFLAAFALCRKLKSYGKKAIRLFYVWIPLSYISRFLRIFPMMAFVLFVQFFVADQLSYGYRVTSRDRNYELCVDSWYKVLFFYANLEQRDDNLCMGHLWYIQCDMQLFLILPWIILLFQHNKIWGLIASLLPFFGGIALRTYFAIHYHFGANLLLPAHQMVNDGNQMAQYFKPWTRMATYFSGVFTMLLILTLREKKPYFKIESRAIFLSLMILSGFIMCCLVFWPYADIKDAPEDRWNLSADQAYYALSRPVWGAALALLSFDLVFKANRMKSIMGTLLGAEIYQPLGKLTYSMYLLHWMVLDWFFKDLNMSTYYEFWTLFASFCATWFVTMFCSVILWFIMEQPMANLAVLGVKALIAKKAVERKASTKSDLSELTDVVRFKNKVKDQNMKGNDILDKLLVEGGGATYSNTTSANNSYGCGACYETSYGGAHGDNYEYSSIKSN